MMNVVSPSLLNPVCACPLRGVRITDVARQGCVAQSILMAATRGCWRVAMLQSIPSLCSTRAGRPLPASVRVSGRSWVRGMVRVVAGVMTQLHALPFGALRAFCPDGRRISSSRCTRWSEGCRPTCHSFVATARCWRMYVTAYWRQAALRWAKCCFCCTTSSARRAPTWPFWKRSGMAITPSRRSRMPALIGDMHLPAYLSTLQEVHDVERRLPVTIPPAKQRTARQRPYHLSDPCMRFYVRFIHPQHDIASYAPERILPALQSGLRAFVGQTVWEDVA